MANRQGDVDLRFAQVSAPSYHFGFGLAEKAVPAQTAEDMHGLEYYCEYNLASIGSFPSGVLLH